MHDWIISVAYGFSAFLLIRAGGYGTRFNGRFWKLPSLSDRQAHVISCSSISVAYALHAIGEIKA